MIFFSPLATSDKRGTINKYTCKSGVILDDICSKVRSSSSKYKAAHDKRYLPYIELGCWLCSHFQLEALNFRKPVTKNYTT